MPNRIVISQIGNPEVLKYESYSLKDNIDDNLVRIKNLAIGVNYIDTYHRSGLYPLPSNPPICPGLEGAGEITMRDLVKNCLRMRPERIIVGEVRGLEAFDLLQAMNTGHDGSMGTIHANNPREAVSRLENMIAMGGFGLPAKVVREQISGSINVIVQAARLRDGSRKITHITEIQGMEGDVVTLQDLYVYEIQGEDDDGKLIGEHKSTGLRPAFFDRAKYFGREDDLFEALGM